MSIISDLQINQQGLPPFSARNCQQKITSFNPLGLRCTVNGEWVCIDPSAPLKYKTVISGTDFSSPGLHHLKIGEKIMVHCIQPFTQIAQAGQVELLRPAVLGSIQSYDALLQKIPFSNLESSVITQNFTEQTCFITYRPILTLVVTDFEMNFHEWGDQNQWILKATE